jgi:Tfp pilus assembly protein PilF
MADFDHAIRLDPSNANAFLARSQAESRSGRADRAAQDYQQAIRLDPTLQK